MKKGNISLSLYHITSVLDLTKTKKSSEPVVWRCSVKKMSSSCNFIKKETLAQLFSSQFCKIFKSIFFTEHLQTAVSESYLEVSICQSFNPLSANPEKWSNTLKQIVGNLSTICLSVFDHFMNLALKGLRRTFFSKFYLNAIS